MKRLAAILLLLPIQAYGATATGVGGGTTLTDSASLRTALSDETGTGVAVFGTSPTLLNPTTSGLTNTGQSTFTSGVTLSSSNPAINIVQTWNNAGATFVGFTENITNTNSAAASLLMDLQVGGVSQFSVSKAGVLTGTLTNCTGLPISTGISGLGTGVAAFLATPTSANLATAITNETGSGALVFGTSPTLVTPDLGTPSAGVLTNCTGINASNISAGTLSAARGGAGSANGILKADGAGAVSAATAGTDYYKSGATTSAPQLIQLCGSKQTPADATTHFFGPYFQFGASDGMSTTGGFRRFYVPYACTVTKCYCFVANHGTAGTSETSSLILRVNDTTDTTLINNTLVTSANGVFSNTGLSVSLAAGDYIEIKWTSPTWATNPTNIGIAVSLEVHP